MKKHPLIIVLGLYSIMTCQLSLADDMSTQLRQLQTQINQLQIKIESIHPITNTVQVNPAMPLGEFYSAYSLLQIQNQYTSPLTLGAEFLAAMQRWGGSALNGIIGPRGSYPSNGSALAATTANADILVNMNDWTHTFIAVQGGLNGYPTIISDAFLNFGDVSKSPYYATIGKTTLPFGSFPGDGPLTNTLADNAFDSTELTQVDVGYSTKKLNSELALFNGQNSINNFVLSMQYNTASAPLTWGLGTGYMNDIRYSGNDIAAAYGTSNGRYNISSGLLQGGANSAVDINSNLAYSLTSTQSLFTAAEWISTTSSATIRSTNNATGKMQAWTLTGGYTIPIENKSTTFAIDYSATTNMRDVPLQLPGAINETALSMLGIKSQWLGYFNMEVSRHIYVGPEFAWQKMYNGQHTWESALTVTAYL
ncbi:MAG: LbtU family siderophore porin [Gammaproteobacteria bacterium]|nr:LbtU family siderophore porin [Gammaproteobacteria bacterium]